MAGVNGKNRLPDYDKVPRVQRSASRQVVFTLRHARTGPIQAVLLILLRGDEPRIEAEATTGHGRVEVAVRQAAVTPSDLPRSVLQYVIRTRERVGLDDASAGNSYSEEEYVRQKHPRSVLCLPIVKQTKLVGALYLENNLTPCAFTSDRIAVLELLASQAAISLENASLYSDLHRSEAFLAQGQRISHTGSFGWSVVNGEVYWSDETCDIFEYDRAVNPTLKLVFQRIHPDDRDIVQQALDNATNEMKDFDIEHRLLMPDGKVKHIHVSARALKTSQGDLEYVGAVTDITQAKQAEEQLRQSERKLRQILDLSPQHIAEFGPDGSRLFVNQAALDYSGLSFEEWRDGDPRRLYHPDDWESTISQTQGKFLSGVPHEAEARLLRKDGKYRWFLVRWSPLRDEQGHLLRWHLAGTDIEDRKQAEQRLQSENVALREEIDKASMFEEIVGTSPPLQTVLSRISKVAPTDSSVLITGETGTGKELVARAIHRRSRRSSRAFVSVNCAAIPRDLIASELFGHEKGAFTGATQRRLGRFELAEGGTIFLDEIGELPAETQIALLRVLQEHEFERVGGTGSIRNDVRVIAATNRDLEAAIAAGSFRRDLFYRLNVFPIEMPPLRERREDIPLLVGYFIERYSRKEGKSFQAVNKKSLDLLQSYPWPGNIRELQNVIERSSIVSSGDIFSVDESWLSKKSSPPPSQVQLVRPTEGESQEEREIIEAALAESKGRVYGPLGAAAKLGIPRSTLESRIKALKIRKNRFKFG
jgi:PAS domain S-box-containing protein